MKNTNKSDLYSHFRPAKVYAKNSNFQGHYKKCRGRYYYWRANIPYFSNAIYCNNIRFGNFRMLQFYVQNHSFVCNKLGL